MLTNHVGNQLDIFERNKGSSFDLFHFLTLIIHGKLRKFFNKNLYEYRKYFFLNAKSPVENQIQWLKQIKIKLLHILYTVREEKLLKAHAHQQAYHLHTYSFLYTK